MDVDAGDILSMYDDLAVEVVSDTSSNEDVALTFSNAELAESICQALGWEDFDLFEEHDFASVLERDDPKECLAYAFLSFLRWRIFTIASARDLGIMVFNDKAAAYSEFWYIRLIENWNVHNPDSTPLRVWVQ